LKILVTGGAGFIGSNFIRYVLRTHPEDQIVNLDRLTYAGNPDNLKDVETDPDMGPRYRFVRGDICEAEDVEATFAAATEAFRGSFEAVVNFAAETHVDRSITGPEDFMRTDVIGTHVLLEAVRAHDVARYLQISTDEVYGSIDKGSFRETDALDPSSPYSASKAGAELLVRAYHTTYGTPVVITRSSNNYGPYQYPEKLIPLFATNALDGLPLPVYGDGMNVRDWIHVDDNCRGVDLVLRNGCDGEIYNIGGGNERPNIEITRRILRATDNDESLLRYVSDRLGHDRRYSIDCGKVRELGWDPQIAFDEGLAQTVAWYRDNRWWWEKIKSGEWRRYYEQHYAELRPSAESQPKPTA
jgi:dTDP-glucose 4,6-dehydratase